MSTSPYPLASAITDIGDGLVMRCATPDDADALASLVVDAHAADGNPAESAGPWMRDLLRGCHPTLTLQSTCLVEDTRTGEIVSTAVLIPQTWSYAGIAFDVGRVELCATATRFRNRGLLRQQIEHFDRHSAERGQRALAITGIPNVYRRFGYEYALEFAGGRVIDAAHIPLRPAGVHEPFRVRRATPDDAAALQAIDGQAVQRSCIACLRDLDMWRYEIQGRSEASILHSTVWMIESADDRRAVPVGYAVLGSGGIPSRSLPGTVAVIRRLEISQGRSWHDVTLSLLRQLCDGIGQRERSKEIRLLLGSEHPAYDITRGLQPTSILPNAWYLRFPDLAGFVNHVAPVLETRLAASPMSGYTDEITLGFYSRGLRLLFRDGRVSAENLSHVTGGGADATFPGLTFLQLLMGYRSLSELEHAFPDCRASRSQVARPLLIALFPRSASWVWPVG